MIHDHLRQWYDMDHPDIEPISHGIINSNFRINSPGGRFLFKIYNRRDDENVSFELGILTFLAQERFPAPRVIPDIVGRLFRHFQGKPAVLLDYIPGRMIVDITQAQMHRIGAGVGLLHRILKNHRQDIERVTWEPADIARHIETRSARVIEKKYPDADRFVDYIAREFQSIALPPQLPLGMTHQDVKPENIIIDSNMRISFIDFNDCYRGTLLYDAMTMVIWSCFNPGGRLDQDLLEAYLRGYMGERPLTPVEREHLYSALLFRLLRESFVWPMRFSPEVAKDKSDFFLNAYKYLKKREKEVCSTAAALGDMIHQSPETRRSNRKASPI